MRPKIYAAFDDVEMAKRAAGTLLDHGIRREDLSLVLPALEDKDEPGKVDRELTGSTQGDVFAGAEVGAAVGLDLGMAGALSSVMIPGVGRVGGSGALAIGLAGAFSTTSAGSISRGIGGYLRDQGIPTEFAMKAEARLRDGGALLSVMVPSGGVNESLARSVLVKYGYNGLEVWPSVAAVWKGRVTLR